MLDNVIEPIETTWAFLRGRTKGLPNISDPLGLSTNRRALVLATLWRQTVGPSGQEPDMVAQMKLAESDIDYRAALRARAFQLSGPPGVNVPGVATLPSGYGRTNDI